MSRVRMKERIRANRDGAWSIPVKGGAAGIVLAWGAASLARSVSDRMCACLPQGCRARTKTYPWPRRRMRCPRCPGPMSWV